MITVVHALTDRNVGGAGVLLRTLLRYTDRTRITPHLLLPARADLIDVCRRDGVAYTEINGAFAAPFSFSALFELCAALRRLRPALLFAHAASQAKLAARLCGVGAVIGVRHCDTPLPRSPLALGLYRATTDLTVATSRPCGERLWAKGLAATVIENGYEPVSPPTAAQRREARALFGIEKDELAVGLVGRLAAVKNHAVALRALSLLRTRMPRLCLHFLGEGEERTALEAEVRARHLEGRVRFHGFRQDPAPFYHAIDIHLSCSLASETSSLALAEGMSAGCVTLASRVAGNPQRVGEGGLLFPPEDAEALAALLAGLGDEAHRAPWRKRALLRSRALPSGKEMAAAYEALVYRFVGFP